MVAATTHYAELKTFATEHPGVTNAAVEFDVTTLREHMAFSLVLFELVASVLGLFGEKDTGIPIDSVRAMELLLQANPDINLLYNGHWNFTSILPEGWKHYGMPTLVGDQVKDAQFEAKGCAISVASASMMTDLVKGKTLDEGHAIARRFTREWERPAAGSPPGRTACVATVR